MSSLIGKKLGNYKISAMLGQGGMAAVYRARQESMARDVALKVIDTSEDSKDFFQKFQSEARTIAALSHPHIIKVFDYGIQDQYAYLVMELLPGGTIGRVLKKGALPVRATYRVLQQLCEALDYAHLKGIVHRDLKPQNVLLDENRNVILTDFGIARLLQRFPINLSGINESVTGTPGYMAPEQWRNENITARTDIYALGVMIFEMLAGRLPFAGSTPKSMMYLHTFHNPPHLRSLRPEIPESVEQVVLRSMAKDPAQRFPSAGDLLVAFRDALGGVSAAGAFSDPDLEEQFAQQFGQSFEPGPVRLDPNAVPIPDVELKADAGEDWFKAEAPAPRKAAEKPLTNEALLTANPYADLEETPKPRSLRRVSVNDIRKMNEASKPKPPEGWAKALDALDKKAADGSAPAVAEAVRVAPPPSRKAAPTPPDPVAPPKGAMSGKKPANGKAEFATPPKPTPAKRSMDEEAEDLRGTLGMPDIGGTKKLPTMTHVTTVAKQNGLTVGWLIAGIMVLIALVASVMLLLT
jgi:serine/threonine protein kinase